MADAQSKFSDTSTGPGCLQPSIENPDGTVLIPTTWIDPETGAAVPTDARCADCGELFGHHHHLASCVEICVRCGEEVAVCGCAPT